MAKGHFRSYRTVSNHSPQVTIAVFSEDASLASLWESYQVLRDRRPKLVRVGSWISGQQSLSADRSWVQTIPGATVLPKMHLSRKTMHFGLLIAPEGDVAQRRQDLTGLRLRCTVLPVRFSFVHEGFSKTNIL